MRIVLVEDNQMLAQGIQKVLSDEGHSVDYFSDGSLADQHIHHEGADLAIIDINLPGMDGVTLTKNLRRRKQAFPVIILTARGATRDRVIGLDAGADDYLVKPFKMDELEARIRALSRRINPILAPKEKIGKIEFDRVNFGYFKDDEQILNSISLNMPGEKMTALVGLSGAGKSTIINLIPRFYNINSGDIKIDNQSIYNITLFSLRKNISYVSQDTTLFDDTIKNNIAYANLDASIDDIKLAAKFSFADEFILEGAKSLISE